MNKKIFSLDAETDGLWGNPFAIAAIVYEQQQVITPATTRQLSGAEMQAKYGPNEIPRDIVRVPERVETNWVETDRFIARLPNKVVTNSWVLENVMPTLESIPVTHDSYEKMLRDFADFYLTHKQDTDCICHMGYIVEAHLLREMHRLNFIGDWDAPYPLLDLSGNLQQAGEDPASVDNYAKKYNLSIENYGTTHNPLYDCEVAAKVYMHLVK